MSARSALEQYLGEVKRRWQLTIATRGAGVTAIAALVLTVLIVVLANRFAFAGWSVTGGRLVLFGGIAAIAALLLVRPLLRLRRREGNRLWVSQMERRFPAFEERVQTFVDQDPGQPNNPMLHLLAEDTLRLAAEAPPSHIASSGRIWGFAGIGVAAVAILIWLGVAGPGYLGYGAARLWGGWLKPSVSNLYQIVVQPGSATIRRKADLLVTAKTIGFESPGARLFARYASSARWEEAPMQPRPDAPGFEFLFAGVEESLRYYVAAGGVRTEEYDVRVVEMPNVKRVRLTYRYPAWTALASNTEEQGGDVRGVVGTEVDVEVETDRPLADGLLRVDNTASKPLRPEGNWSRGRLTIDKDGQYFVAAMYAGELVRLTDDFFIQAAPDQAPTIKISRPSRDWRATSIEEVTVQAEAADDFGLRGFDLHYSVNGGEEKKIPMQAGGRKDSSGSQTFLLEDFSLVPGDVVSYYAVARDAKTEVKTDIFFIEIQPFEREFFQAQAAGGGGGGGGENESGEISRRQKEIIAAAWNLARERNLDKQKAAEHAKTLSGIQNKLRDQARTLAERVKRRELAGVNNDFKAFVENMERAADAMGPTSEKLAGQKWQEAMGPGQKSLQHLQRAESIFRQIQVAFGQGGGGGGGNSGRDLAEMFDLELDREKNQYETGRQNTAEERDRKLDEALEKLKELARRQEQLAEQQRRQQMAGFDQRWQQEMLRREAEDLTRRLQEMQQQAQQNQSGSQQAQQGQGGRPSPQQPGRGQQGAQQGNQPGSAQLQRALERLQQATRDMQDANQPRGQERSMSQQDREAAQRRAQERLREVEQMLAGLRRQQSGDQMEDLERRATDLAERQQRMAEQLQEALRRALETANQPGQGQRDPLTGRQRIPPGMSNDQAQALVKEKEDAMRQLEALEKKMQEAARGLASTQPKASKQLRETLGNLQQAELPTRMKLAADLLRQGLAPYAAQREEPVTRALNQLRDGIQQTRRLAQGEQPGGEGVERALNRVEQLRRQLEQALAAQQDRQGQQQGQQSGQQGEQGQGQQSGGQNSGGRQSSGDTNSGQFGPGPQSPGARGGNRGGPYGGGDRWRYGGDASNRGDWQAIPPGQIPPPDRAFRDGRDELLRIERGLRNDPEFGRDLDELRKEMARLDNLASRFPGNPALLSREQQKLLYEIEQLELMLRRKVDEKQGAQVRAGAEQPVPEDWRKAVAEYFRRLSK